MLTEFRALPVRVFVVWERVTLADRARPTSRVLARVSDPRAAQFWDPGRVVAQKILDAARADPSDPFVRCCAQRNLVWDAVAVFPKEVRWDDALPAAQFAGRTVVDVAAQLHEELARAAR